MTDLRAAVRFLVTGGELQQALGALMLAEERALENSVLGEASHPVRVMPQINGVGIACVQFADLLAIFPGSGYGHDLTSSWWCRSWVTGLAAAPGEFCINTI